MNPLNFGDALGPVARPTPDQVAAIRANVTAAARDADDAELLCAALGVA